MKLNPTMSGNVEAGHVSWLTQNMIREGWLHVISHLTDILSFQLVFCNQPSKFLKLGNESQHILVAQFF